MIQVKTKTNKIKYTDKLFQYLKEKVLYYFLTDGYHHLFSLIEKITINDDYLIIQKKMVQNIVIIKKI